MTLVSREILGNVCYNESRSIVNKSQVFWEASGCEFTGHFKSQCYSNWESITSAWNDLGCIEMGLRRDITQHQTPRNNSLPLRTHKTVPERKLKSSGFSFRARWSLSTFCPNLSHVTFFQCHPLAFENNSNRRRKTSAGPSAICFIDTQSFLAARQTLVQSQCQSRWLITNKTIFTHLRIVFISRIH